MWPFNADKFHEINFALSFWTLVTFTLLLIVLRKVAWGPILTMVETREKTIADAIEAAKKEMADAEKIAGETKAELDMRAQMAELVRKSQGEVAAAKTELMAQAKKESEELLLQARKTIAEEQRTAVAQFLRPDCRSGRRGGVAADPVADEQRAAEAAGRRVHEVAAQRIDSRTTFPDFSGAKAQRRKTWPAKRRSDLLKVSGRSGRARISIRRWSRASGWSAFASAARCRSTAPPDLGPLRLARRADRVLPVNKSAEKKRLAAQPALESTSLEELLARDAKNNFDVRHETITKAELGKSGFFMPVAAKLSLTGGGETARLLHQHQAPCAEGA